MLREGEALTPFVLDALLRVDPQVCKPPPRAIDRALDFMRPRIDASGMLGVSDPELLEYPCYATAFAVRCFVLAGADSDRVLLERMCTALHRKQFQESVGYGRRSENFPTWYSPPLLVGRSSSWGVVSALYSPSPS